MLNKNIAFAGSIQTGKSTLQNKVVELLDDKLTVTVGNNLPKKILDLLDIKYLDYFQDSEELELSCAFSRRVDMLSASPDYHVVADEWALNDLAKVMVKINDLETKIKASSQMLGPDGKPIFTENHGKFVIIQSVFQILLNQVALEKDFWNFLYYIPICEPKDDILDESGILPKDRLKQKELDLAINTLIKQLNIKVVKLPIGKKNAFKFLEAEKGKWIN